MTALILLLALLLLSWLRLRSTIRQDGYGSRPGPRSHHGTFEGTLDGRVLR